MWADVLKLSSRTSNRLLWVIQFRYFDAHTSPIPNPLYISHNRHCNCQETNDFMGLVRLAYSQNNVLWSTKSGDLIIGTEYQAKERLNNGSIDCYIKPIKRDEITFEVISELPKEQPKEPDVRTKFKIKKIKEQL